MSQKKESSMSEPNDPAPQSLRTLLYDDTGSRPSLQVLDQLLIPDEKKYIDIPDVKAAWTVIRDMNIRGMCSCRVVPWNNINCPLQVTHSFFSPILTL